MLHCTCVVIKHIPATCPGVCSYHNPSIILYCHNGGLRGRRGFMVNIMLHSLTSHTHESVACETTCCIQPSLTSQIHFGMQGSGELCVQAVSCCTYSAVQSNHVAVSHHIFCNFLFRKYTTYSSADFLLCPLCLREGRSLKIWQCRRHGQSRHFYSWGAL